MTRTVLLAVLAIIGLAALAPLAYAHDGVAAHPHVADFLFLGMIAATIVALLLERRSHRDLLR